MMPRAMPETAVMGQSHAPSRSSDCSDLRARVVDTVARFLSEHEALCDGGRHVTRAHGRTVVRSC